MTARLTRSESRAYLVKVSQYRGTRSCDSHISDTLFHPSPPYSPPQHDRRRVLWQGTRQVSQYDLQSVVEGTAHSLDEGRLGIRTQVACVYAGRFSHQITFVSGSCPRPMASPRFPAGDPPAASAPFDSHDPLLFNTELPRRVTSWILQDSLPKQHKRNISNCHVHDRWRPRGCPLVIRRPLPPSYTCWLMVSRVMSPTDGFPTVPRR